MKTAVRPLPIKWSALTAEEIPKRLDEIIKTHRSTLDAVAKLAPQDCTIESVAMRLMQADNRFADERGSLTFLRSVSTSEDVRNASKAADDRLDEFSVECLSRIDVYQALEHSLANFNALPFEKHEAYDKSIVRFLDTEIKSFKRAGVGLPEEKRNEYAKLKTQLDVACSTALENLDKEDGHMFFSKEELIGVPDDVLAQYTKDEASGKYKVSHKTPDYVPIMDFCQNPKTRKAAQESYRGKVKEANTPLFDKIIRLRGQIKDLLGYKTWADFKTEERLAKNAETVGQFLDDLGQKLLPLAQNEVSQLLALKNEEPLKLGDDKLDKGLAPWDIFYLTRLYKEKHLNIDQTKIKEFFPVDFVVPAILDKYKALFQCRFERVDDAEVWHDDVKLYAVFDACEDEAQNYGFLGYLYLDLYPRKNKYGHAAHWTLVSGYEREDGSRQFPVSAVVANLAKPTAATPALLPFQDVVTLFHELGHAFHNQLSRAKYSGQSGTRVSRDFVEAPSQMLENWCWTKEILSMSQHCQTKQMLDQDLYTKLVESRYVMDALAQLKQVFNAKLDFTMHTREDITNMAQVEFELENSLTLTTYSKPQYFYTGFGHLLGGYDAGYYGYLYSQVFSDDMFQTIFAEDPMSKDAGMRYRRCILEPGSSRDEMESLTMLLGRKPNNIAFLKKYGLTDSPPKL